MLYYLLKLMSNIGGLSILLHMSGASSCFSGSYNVHIQNFYSNTVSIDIAN